MTYLTDTDPDLAFEPLQAAACTYRIALSNPLKSPADLTILQAAACTYRIALGPRAGQNVLSLQTAPTQEASPTPECCQQAGL